MSIEIPNCERYIRVEEIEREADDIVRLTLSDEHNKSLPSYDCGAHIDLHLPAGIVRQYSLVDPPGAGPVYRIAVKRESMSRGGSKYIHDDMRVGEKLKISTPRNNFGLDPSAAHVVLLAGGIGVTPLISMAQFLAASERTFALHYFTRSTESTAFLGLIQTSKLKDRTRNYFGLGAKEVEKAAEEVLRYQSGSHLYLCGPTFFMDVIKSTAERQNWPQSSIHFEYFSAPVSRNEISQDAFEVQLSRTGQVFQILPSQTIADVLARNGVPIQTSCEQGICGTCVTKVLEGVPDHRDFYLSDQEKSRSDKMTICTSRSKTKRIVLDI